MDFRDECEEEKKKAVAAADYMTAENKGKAKFEIREKISIPFRKGVVLRF